MREEPSVFLAARAVESDAEDRRVRGTRELLDAPKVRKQHVRLSPRGAGKGVTAGERVVHADVVETTSDAESPVLSAFAG